MQTVLFFFLGKKVADAYIGCGVPIGNYIFKKPLFDDRSTNPTVAYSLSVVAFYNSPPSLLLFFGKDLVRYASKKLR